MIRKDLDPYKCISGPRQAQGQAGYGGTELGMGLVPGLRA